MVANFITINYHIPFDGKVRIQDLLKMPLSQFLNQRVLVDGLELNNTILRIIPILLKINLVYVSLQEVYIYIYINRTAQLVYDVRQK